MKEVDNNIILDEYESAVFLAREKCRHKDRKPLEELNRYSFSEEIEIVDGREVKHVKVTDNPKYKPYSKGELERIREEENTLMYDYLKNKYPNKDFAEKYKKYCSLEK